MNGRPLLAAFALVPLLVALAWGAASLRVRGASGPLTDPIDLLAFRCAGIVAASGGDPYRVEPLRTCEDASLAASGIPAVPYVAVPAPLPPYALAAFGLAPSLDFPSVAATWFVASLAAIAATVVGLRRLAGVPLLAAAAAAVPFEACTSLQAGQLVPVVACALVGAALAARAGLMWLAAAALGVAALEPHVALPAFAGAFAAVPAMRRPLGGVALALVLASLAGGGAARTVEYALRVVPLHAREATVDIGGQYGLTAVLAHAGVPAEAALRAGALWYLAALVSGVLLAVRLVRHFDDRAFAVATPPAVAMFGGTFVHEHQMAVAFPLAFLLVARLRGASLPRVALVCIAIPWQSVLDWILAAHGHAVTAADVRALAPLASPDRYAQDVWQGWLRLRQPHGTDALVATVLKVPTWFGLAALAACAVAAVRAPSAHAPAGAPRVRTRADAARTAIGA